MYQIATTNQFKKDYKLCKRLGYKLNLINILFAQLEKDGTVNSKFNPHKLTCNYKGFWECHIQPDWLLLWLIDEDEMLITLSRTGTHSDLY